MFKKKNNDNVFIETKKQPIKFKGYKFIGYHNDWAVGYYIRKCDNLNNCNFMEVKIAPDRTIDAGTKVSIIDAFMYDYLKFRKKILEKPEFLTKGDLLKYSSLMFTNKEKLKYYSLMLPKQIKNTTLVNDLFNDGFKLLYVFNNETGKRKYATVKVVMVKEETLSNKINKELNISYVRFKYLEYLVKPSYVLTKKGDKYIKSLEQDINIPTYILK